MTITASYCFDVVIRWKTEILWRIHVLSVIALETGGRWGDEAVAFVAALAAARARDAPPALRRSAALAWERRWARMLSVACARRGTSDLMWYASAGVTPGGVGGGRGRRHPTILPPL